MLTTPVKKCKISIASFPFSQPKLCVHAPAQDSSVFMLESQCDSKTCHLFYTHLLLGPCLLDEMESGTLAIASAPRLPPARPIRITQRVHLSSLLSYSQSPSLAMLLLILDINMDSCSGRLILTCTRFKVFAFINP
jgi:hypothetical protein